MIIKFKYYFFKLAPLAPLGSHFKSTTKLEHHTIVVIKYNVQLNSSFFDKNTKEGS